MLVFVCAGGSPSLKWLFSIISRVSFGVSVRVPSGLYTESSFAFLSLQFFRILLILADSLADSVSAQNLHHLLHLVLVWSLLYVLLLMRRLSQRVGLLLLLAAMSLRFMSQCAFSTSGVSHGGFLIVLDMYVRGHALLNAQKNPGFFWILGSNFFGGLNQKSAMISMCKIHIYIDSESFRQIR